MDFATARARVRETASLTTADDERVGEFVNEAIVDFMRDAAPVVERFTITTVADQVDYDLDDLSDAGVLRILGDFPHDLNVAVETDRYNVMGLTTLVLRDTPADGGELLLGWCVPRPEELVVTTDDAVELPGPREWHRAILYRALQLACEWDRQDDSEIQKWEAKYEGEVGKCRRSRTRMVGGSQRGRLRPASRLASTFHRSWMDWR